MFVSDVSSATAVAKGELAAKRVSLPVADGPAPFEATVGIKCGSTLGLSSLRQMGLLG